MTTRFSLPTGRVPERKHRLWAVGLTVLFAVCALMGTGWGYANWASSATFGAGPVVHGALTVEEPTETWELTADQGQKVLAASTADDAGLALGALANLSTPCGSGTELEVVYTYPLVWKGDNLTVRLTVTPVAVAGGRVTVEDGKGAALVSEASLNASSQVDVPVGTDTLRVILKYQMPACDPYGSSDVEYGGHTLKVDQT